MEYGGSDDGTVELWKKLLSYSNSTFYYLSEEDDDFEDSHFEREKSEEGRKAKRQLRQNEQHPTNTPSNKPTNKPTGSPNQRKIALDEQLQIESYDGAKDGNNNNNNNNNDYYYTNSVNKSVNNDDVQFNGQPNDSQQ